MECILTKIEWEYGEAYGHVFFPTDLASFKTKLHELHQHAIEQQNPFYVELFFVDNTYIGLIVGHELSCLCFGVPMIDDHTSHHDELRFDNHYDRQKTDDGTYIQYSFKGDHGEKELAALLPRQQVLDALHQYIETQTFPRYVRLTRPEFIDQYICSD